MVKIMPIWNSPDAIVLMDHRSPHRTDAREPHYVTGNGSTRTAAAGYAWAGLVGNDGIGLTARLVLDATAANATHKNATVARIAGLVARAMSMAGGERVSVRS